MKEINFISSGMMGDFIHSLSTVKNICERENAVANVFITDNVSVYGYDQWRYGTARAYRDLCDMVMAQDYINKFKILELLSLREFQSLNILSDECINLNVFRNGLMPPFNTWTKLLSSTFNYEIPKEYKWINLDVEKTNKIVIHCSIRRKNLYFNWGVLRKVFDDILFDDTELVFVTSSLEEYENFSYITKLKLVNTMLEMATEIASAKYFIGNQSAPFALASALDVPRLVILDAEPAPFYMGEQEFSDNISWYLNDNVKYKAEGCIVSI